MSEYQPPLERRKFIVTTIEQGDTLRIADVAKMFGCSERGVLNDLKYLRSLGLRVGTRRGIIEARKDKTVTLLRKLEFPPQYKESAVSILSYFSRVLEQKYPEMDAGVSILQRGQTVTLKIETKEGEISTIERTLDEYGQVVVGDLAPDEFFNDPLAIVELKNRLEVAKLELRLKEQSHLIHSSYQEKRVESLEDQLKELRCLVGAQLTTVSNLSSTIAALGNSERISPAVANALNTLNDLIQKNYSTKNESDLRQALETIRKEDQGLFKKLFGSVSILGHSVFANLATPWVQSVIHSLPK